MAVRVHPFPSRTRQLSSLALTILGWKRPGKISRCQHKSVGPAPRIRRVPDIKKGQTRLSPALSLYIFLLLSIKCEKRDGSARALAASLVAAFCAGEGRQPSRRERRGLPPPSLTAVRTGRRPSGRNGPRQGAPMLRLCSGVFLGVRLCAAGAGGYPAAGAGTRRPYGRERLCMAGLTLLPQTSAYPFAFFCFIKCGREGSGCRQTEPGGEKKTAIFDAVGLINGHGRLLSKIREQGILPGFIAAESPGCAKPALWAFCQLSICHRDPGRCIGITLRSLQPIPLL